MSKKKVILAASTVVAVLLLTFHFLEPVISPSSLVDSRFSGKGAIKAVGIDIYSDSGLHTKLSSIDWSILEAGASQNFTCYIKNLGNSVIVLALATANWNPPTAAKFVTLKWDYAGSPVVPNGVIKVTFTLGISPNITGVANFSFGTIITSSRA